jgi:hypothetical protein
LPLGNLQPLWSPESLHTLAVHIEPKNWYKNWGWSAMSDRITVLNYGEKIVERLSSEVRQEQKAIEAYLGGKRSFIRQNAIRERRLKVFLKASGN